MSGRRDLVRRAAEPWRARRPSRLRVGAARLVLPAYYAAQLGDTSFNLRGAERHYVSTGWKQGLLPHPFLGDHPARWDLDEARSLRNAVAKTLNGQGAALPRLVGELDLRPLLEHHPDVLTHRLGPIGYVVGVLARSSRVGIAPRHVDPDLTGAPWTTYLDRLEKRAAEVRGVLASPVFDRPAYESQVGRTFLSPEAALAHYLDVGERTGHSPNPAFEPEWWVAHRGKTPRPTGSPLLDFLASDQTGSPSPTFDGARWADGREAPSHGWLVDVLRSTQDDAPAPVADRVAPVTLGEAREVVRTAHADALQDREAVHGRRPVEPTSARTGGDAPVTILVDVRSLPRHGTVKDLKSGKHPVRVMVLVPDSPQGVLMSKNDLGFLAEDPRVTVVRGERGEAMSAIAERAVVEAGHDLVTSWAPGQVWGKSFLSTATATLASDSALTAATAGVGAWSTAVDPLWADGHETLAGTLVRRSAVDGPLFAEYSDGGHEWDLLLRLADTKVAHLAPGLVTLKGQLPPFERRNRRRWANEVRQRRLITGPVEGRVEDRVSLLIPTYEEWSMTLRAVRTAFEHAEGLDVEVVIVDNGSRPAVTRILRSAFAGDDRVSVRRMPVNTDFALGSNLALAGSTGEHVVFLNNDTEATPGWLAPLVEAVRAGASAAQPRLLYPSGTVQTAGTVFVGQAMPPVHLLAEHPGEDGLHPGLGTYDFSAVTAACMAMRADDAERLDGFDPQYVNGMEDVDFCLRLGELTGRPLRVVPTSTVVHHESQTPGRMDRALFNRTLFVDRWKHRLTTDLDDRTVLDGTHLRVSGVRTAPQARERTIRRSTMVTRRPEAVVAEGPAAGLPRLRWAIKTAIPGDSSGELWGDWFFAHDLMKGLRALGQEVVLDRRPNLLRPESDHLDDVTLTLRGWAQFQPSPWATNLLWVISHPEDVGRRELQLGWDHVYSAGPVWGRTAGEEAGVEVKPLLQATDPERFNPARAEGSAHAHDALFVGRTRGVYRPIVRDAIDAGADLAIYGDGWEKYIDAHHVVDDHLANAEVPGAYAASRIVLNDHWEDMRDAGFLSNRLFDAAAAGALVVTDDVPGLSDVFGPNVRSYRTVEELAVLLSHDGSDPWPGAEERLALAAEVARLHSFEARARELLADVLDTRGVAHDLRG